jgi:hypothetical protein
MIVNLQLSIETATRLGEKAARKGQTLETLLVNLADHEAEESSNVQSSDAEPHEVGERPWRGVFVLDYPRQEIFAVEREVNINALPPLPTEVQIDLRRLADESE